MLASDIWLWLQQTLLICKFHELIEIAIISLTIHQCCQWLASDYTKPLLLYVYSYGYAVIASYFFNVSSLYHILLLCAPIFFMLLIIQHHKNLQKHFVLKQQPSITPATTASLDWVESILRSGLLATHHHKSVTYIIERNDILDTLFSKPFTLYIPAQKELLDILIMSNSYQSKKNILIKADGTLISTNVEWSEVIQNELLFTKESATIYPQAQAKILTQKTDALVCHLSAENKHFIAYQGTIITDMHINQMTDMLYKIVHTKVEPFQAKQGHHYDHKKNIAP